MKQRYAYILSPMLLFASCGDSPTLSTTPPVNNPTPGETVVDFYVSPASTQCLTDIVKEDGRGMDAMLGYGYDITGAYLSSRSFRGCVVDISKLPQDELSVLSAPAYNSGELLMGADVKSFLGDLMANVGMGSTDKDPSLCFTGTLVSASADATTMLNISSTRVISGSFTTAPEVIAAALSDDFARDSRYMRASSLVEIYGTHFLVHVDAGLAVRTLYSAYVDSPAEEKTIKAREGMEAAGQAMAGKLGPDLTLTLSGLGNYGATYIRTFCGGDSSLVEYDPATGLLGDVTAWEESGSTGNYTLTDMSPGDILPLSAAISDPVLKKEVDEAISRHIADSREAVEATVPLIQNTDGKYYRYVTSYEESMRLEDSEGLRSFGILGSLYSRRTGESIPLYTSIAEDGSQILSLIQPDDDWLCMGYVMPSRSYNTVSLYEITDGLRYAYTIEAANSYGKHNEWHPTGAVFHLLRP